MHFEGVASLKQKKIEEGEYVICDINGDFNNRPVYVFKTSKFLLNLASPNGYFLTSHTKGLKALKLTEKNFKT